MADLLGGAAGDQIVAPVHFIQQSPELLEVLLSPILGNPELNGIAAVLWPGAFWLKRNVVLPVLTGHRLQPEDLGIDRGYATRTCRSVMLPGVMGSRQPRVSIEAAAYSTENPISGC